MIDKRLVLAVAMILLTLPFCGCFGAPAKEEGDKGTPANKLKIVPYVSETHQFYDNKLTGSDANGWWGTQADSDATEDYFWLDIRNLGRNNQRNVHCYIKNQPSDWVIRDIDPIAEPGETVKLDFNKQTGKIAIIYAQHNEASGTWHPESETTLMLRFRVSTGVKGGYDTDMDGYPESLTEVENSVQVGYFVGSYTLFFHATSEDGGEDSIKLTVKVQEQDSKVNYYHPYRDDRGEIIDDIERPDVRDKVDSPSSILSSYMYSIVIIVILIIVLVVVWMFWFSGAKKRRGGKKWI